MRFSMCEGDEKEVLNNRKDKRSSLTSICDRRSADVLAIGTVPAWIDIGVENRMIVALTT